MQNLKTFILFASTLLLFSCKNYENVHKRVLVIDTHVDTPMMLMNQAFDLGERHSATDLKVDYPRLKEGGVDAIFFAVFINQQPLTNDNFDKAFATSKAIIDSTLVSVKQNSHLVELAIHSSHAEKIALENKTAIYLGLENGFPLAQDLSRIEYFYNKGIRYITLSHSYNNQICDASTDNGGELHGGLSDFGHEVLAEMNRLGMMIDVSHISDKAFFDVIEQSKAPVIASHSSVRSICDHPRNLSDEMILALAKNGGVIQICLLGDYISQPDTTSLNYLKKQELRKKYNNWNYNDDNERKAAWAEWYEIENNYPPELPTIADAVNHIDYVVNLVGIDYVGIGSDFDGGGALADCPDVAAFSLITHELLSRGYTECDIRKIWGGNLLRVFRQVEELSYLF